MAPTNSSLTSCTPGRLPHVTVRQDTSSAECAQLPTSADAELGEALAQVVLHGVNADEELGRYLVVGPSLGHQGGHVRLAIGQLQVRRGVTCDGEGPPPQETSWTSLS